MAELSRHPRHSTDNGIASGSTIYDYPEHLNPFYEDENHKRLRFWSSKPYKSQRRGSLSSLRDGLRELWQFSSIRFGKKRSSTLGINKTSESPPPLRRDAYDPDSSGASVSGYRNTVGASAYGMPRESQSYTTTPLFERQTRYRSSLQPRSQAQNNEDLGFSRNTRYRSTVQNGFATYNSGMVTSTPRKKQAAPQPYGTTPRVPPQQLNNSNPFEDEVEPDGDTISTFSMDSNYSSTLRSRGTRTRTKRRAPPPPPVTVKPANRPDQPVEMDENQSEDLRNLTAEIASFVSSVTTADESAREETTEQTGASEDARTAQTHDVNNNNARSEIPTTVSSMESETVQENRVTVDVQKDPPTKAIVQVIVESHVSESKTVPDEPESKPNNVAPPPTEEETIGAKTSPVPVPRKKSEKQQPSALPQTLAKEEIDFENLSLPETPVPTRRSNRERYITEQVKPMPAKPLPVPTEPTKPPVATAGQEEDDEGPTTTIIVDNLHYKLKVAPIHTEINTKIENARLKISESTGNIASGATDSGTVERRRSVKDIIESINKSQSMLKVNLDPSGMQGTQSTDSMTRNIRELNEREKEIQNLLQDIDSRYGGAASTRIDEAGGQDTASAGTEAVLPSGRGSYYDNLAEDPNLSDNLDDMNNMYAASGHRVKKSPTKTVIIAQTDEQIYQDCMDWNPLPKPRRSHILVENASSSDQSLAVESAP